MTWHNQLVEGLSLIAQLSPANAWHRPVIGFLSANMLYSQENDVGFLSILYLYNLQGCSKSKDALGRNIWIEMALLDSPSMDITDNIIFLSV